MNPSKSFIGLNSIYQRLHLKMGITVALCALLVSLISSLGSYYSSFSREKNKNLLLVEQLAKTVEQTASISAYLSDSELADEIVDGLTGHDLVKNAKIESNENVVLAFGNSTVDDISVSLDLLHPFAQDHIVGQLLIYPDIAFIHRQAKAEAYRDAQVLVILSLSIFIITMLMVHNMLTKPLRSLTKSFAQVDPEKPATMKMLEHSRTDEIGQLVAGINALMTALQFTLDKEKDLRKRTQALEAKFRLIFEQASAGICLINKYDHLMAYNPAFKQIHNLPDANIIDVTELFKDSAHVASLLSTFRRESLAQQFSIDLQLNGSKDGTKWLHCLFAKIKDQRKLVRDTEDVVIEAIMYDITERVQREQETRIAAECDPLTNLNNRRAGNKRLAELLQRCLLEDKSMVLMMVDLDKFKPINDTYGHDAGDRVLIECGQRIANKFGKDSVCIRWGGDEFVIAYPLKQGALDTVVTIGESLIASLSESIDVGDEMLCQIGASIGVVIAPQHATTLDELLAKADQAMYLVKQQGRGKCSLYSEVDSTADSLN